MASHTPTLPRPRRLRRSALAGLLAGALLLAFAGTAAASTLSSNWAGWVALPNSSSHATFNSVSGTWQVPALSCSTRPEHLLRRLGRARGLQAEQ